ncbi:MAG: hypothetical protein HOP34_08855 [Methylococcaceae bacterium]|nr:hypothetical protein [Methylococcaceae bacterium]
MNTKVSVPPIKSQGIKTKLVPWIKSIVPNDFNSIWIEPFMGTGAVAFNVAPQHAILSDTNPHLINFYSGLASGEITPNIVKAYLIREGALLLEKGEEHHYFIRDRFNSQHFIVPTLRVGIHPATLQRCVFSLPSIAWELAILRKLTVRHLSLL